MGAEIFGKEKSTVKLDECKEDSYGRETDRIGSVNKINECDLCAINETGLKGN